MTRSNGELATLHPNSEPEEKEGGRGKEGREGEEEEERKEEEEEEERMIERSWKKKMRREWDEAEKGMQ